ncbi:MAG: hypothetical protein F9K13_02515 [Candidatus Methylomirabilis oxygeniifera]|uniref:Uncharacterized protein n=1 Tax=Methylomirabilis oxygeniifera TaxID=671143 RepID=D5MF19_METO1|nr:MAG: hypothetical protein F9K13_02515 [Candidatus Methylomirabilis oxyfera]CBE68348.1 protein of unknown function [Candidatus Methylomirabilis oxyfera]
MDPALINLIQQAIHDGITAAGFLVAVICLVAAGTGAFLASYLKTKGKNFATKEDFNGLLEQIKAQTKVTEDIKAEIQRELNAFSDTLQRGREFAGFRRERIVGHLDHVIEAYTDIYGVAQLVPLRLWLISNTDLDTEGRFRASLSRLRAHFGALQSLEVIPNAVSGAFVDKGSRVLDSWNQVLGEAALRTEAYRKEHPDSRSFSAERYHQSWMQFMTHVEELGAVVKGLSRTISLPQ